MFVFSLVCLRMGVYIHMQMSKFSLPFAVHINVGKFTAKLHHLLANCAPILASLSTSLSLCAVAIHSHCIICGKCAFQIRTHLPVNIAILLVTVVVVAAACSN